MWFLLNDDYLCPAVEEVVFHLFFSYNSGFQQTLGTDLKEEKKIGEKKTWSDSRPWCRTSFLGGTCRIKQEILVSTLFPPPIHATLLIIPN